MYPTKPKVKDLLIMFFKILSRMLKCRHKRYIIIEFYFESFLNSNLNFIKNTCLKFIFMKLY